MADQPNPSTGRRCRFCGKTIAATDRVCPHCNRDTISGVVQPPPVEPVEIPIPAPRPISPVIAVRRAPEFIRFAGSTSSTIVFVLCGAVALIAWIVGSLELSNATFGVGAIAAACLFAIFARCAQAESHHREQLAWIKWVGEQIPIDKQ